MKLLIITQTVDKNNPVLGFFHRWIEEFSKNFEKITVVCLEKGIYDLPENVEVYSLGKEKLTAKSYKLKAFIKIKYLFNFYRLIFKFRKEYDSVFVHMNQEYVLLGGDIWRVMGKKIYLWRNHAKGNILTRIAVLLSHKVFCTSPQSYTAKFKKTQLMSAGIDTDFFRPDPSAPKKKNSILFLGRISPVKNVHVFVESLNSLKKAGVDFFATIAGGATLKDVGYEKRIRDMVLRYGLSENVQFTGPVTQGRALQLYRENELYVNLTPDGSFDKTILEAMSSGVSVLISNSAFREHTSDVCFMESYSPENIANNIKILLSLEDSEIESIRKRLREYVEKNHSLDVLFERFFKIF